MVYLGIKYNITQSLLLGGNTVVLSRPQLGVVDNRVAVGKFGGTLVLTKELLIVSGLDVPSVVLVEVVELVVDVDGAFNGVWRSSAVLE